MKNNCLKLKSSPSVTIALGIVALTSTSCVAQSGSEKAVPASTSPAIEKVPLVINSPAAKTTWKFAFGSKAASDSLLVTPTTTYSVETGYGFEPESQVTVGANGISSEKPFFFSAAVPEGFYDVTVTLGNSTAASTTTVKGEARRLMLQNVPVAAGKSEKRTFTIAVKRPQLSSGSSIRLKPSQRPTNWDEKLTLEFNGINPSVSSIEIAPAKSPVGVFIAGDSTVTDNAGEPFTGWGQMLPRFFKSGTFVWNEAQSGESLSSFKGGQLLKKVLENARPNDYFFIQFGHNDQKDKKPNAGPFTSYKANLKTYIAEARKKQIIPVLVTPMERRRFTGETATQTLADYAEAVRQTGQEENVLVIDLNATSLKFYTALGPENSKKAFVHYPAKTYRSRALADDTHFNSYGAYELARIVVTAIKESKLDLAKFITDDYVAFDPAKPDDFNTFVLPSTPTKEIATPEGS